MANGEQWLCLTMLRTVWLTGGKSGMNSPKHPEHEGPDKLNIVLRCVCLIAPFMVQFGIPQPGNFWFVLGSLHLVILSLLAFAAALDTSSGRFWLATRHLALGLAIMDVVLAVYYALLALLFYLSPNLSLIPEDFDRR
jgi:hypothetical protein